MLTAIDFVSLAVFEDIVPAVDMAAISIGDPAQLPPKNLGRFDQSLRLEFLDLEPDTLPEYLPDEALFSKEHLAALISFVSALHDSADRYRLVVHCRLGMSRSAAVALIAHHLTRCDFPRYAAAHYANKYVIRLAEHVLRESITQPSKQDGLELAYIPQQLQI